MPSGAPASPPATSEGPPGLRHYHAAYYGAFLRDPDGHLVEIDGVPGGDEPAGVRIVPLSELRPQEGERLRATLFQTGIPFRNGAGPA